VKNRPKRPSEVFAERLREARERKRWSQQDLADRLAEMGEPVDRATIARTETGARGVYLDDAVAYAAALGASFLHMVVPLGNDQPVIVAPNLVVSPIAARQWMRAQAPLRPEDQRTLVTESPDDEWVGRQNVLVNVLLEKVQSLIDAWGDKDRSVDIIEKQINPVLDILRRDLAGGRPGRGAADRKRGGRSGQR
jgi:transcriptional regulator with XRE-family HTH domain